MRPAPGDVGRPAAGSAPRLFIAAAGFAFLALLIGALAFLVLALQSDRDALINAVETERLEQVDAVARLVEEDVDDVLDDLELIARVIRPEATIDSVRPILLAVLGGTRAYRLAGLYGAGETPPAYISSPRRDTPSPTALHTHMDQLAVAMKGGDAFLEISPIISLDDSLFRIFGVPAKGGSVVVLAVETTAWLSAIRHLSSDPMNRVLVIGPSGRVAPASDTSLRDVLTSDAVIDASLQLVLDRMRDGERGSSRISRTSARTLGLDDAELVVAFTPIRLRDHDLWALATFTSLSTLRTQEQALIVRFGVAGATILLLLIAFAAYVVLATKRHALLQQRLAHATEVEALHAQLIHAEKLATVGGLSAGIAHEIGTPLGVIRGRAEYVLKKLPDGDPLARSLHTITGQIDRVSRIINELLDFARPRPAVSRATPLHEVYRKTFELMEIEYEKADIDLHAEVATSLPPLAADPDQLQQVLVNLLVNARDACKPGDAVVIRASQHREAVSIEIADNGAGMPPELVSQVFDPFFTTKKRGHGTGLGLSIVSQIVRAHGGDVEIESAVGKGTVVHLRWPIATDASTK